MLCNSSGQIFFRAAHVQPAHLGNVLKLRTLVILKHALNAKLFIFLFEAARPSFVGGKAEEGNKIEESNMQLKDQLITPAYTLIKLGFANESPKVLDIFF